MAYPATGEYREATATDTNCNFRYNVVNFFIPIKKNITKSTDVSAYPFELPYYYLMSHVRHQYGAAVGQWIIERLYTQAVFKDV
ncbi:hypothetical protein HAPG_00111 [Halorubrum phage GNf2]|nr:hypothetical protein HAPG_00111 [Halorubrum phage GNf2]